MPDLTNPVGTGRAAGSGNPAADHNYVADNLNWLFDHLELPLSMQLAYEDIYVPDGVVPVAIRHDDNPTNDYQAAQYLRDRHMVGGFALIGDNFLPQISNSITFAQATEMQSWGMEMMGHSYSHAAGAPTSPLWDEVITLGDQLRAKDLYIQNWARPGTWTGILETYSSFDSRLGQAARRQYVALESYIVEGWGNKVRTFPVTTPYGGEYVADTTLSGIQARYDQAADAEGAIEVLFHTGGWGAVGSASWNEYTAVLDWLVGERNAGRAMIMTPTALQKAKRGPRRNIAPDSSFEARGFDPTNSAWKTTGTATASTVARTGTYSLNAATNGGVILQPAHEDTLRSLEITGYARADTANASARLVMTLKQGATTLHTRTVTTPVTSAGWTSFRGCMGMDPRADLVQISLLSSTSNVLFDDVAIYKT